MRTCLPGQYNPTRISYQWAEAVKKDFEANGWQVLDLAVDDAVRSNAEKLLQNSESIVFLFYGHGRSDQMLGQDKVALIDLTNLNLLKNRKAYIVACKTAKVLGRAAENISRFYLGYKECIRVYLLQPYAACLGNCINKGILAMLNTPDRTIEQARQFIVDEYNHWIDYYSVGAGAFDYFSTSFAAALRYNRDSLAQVFGDRVATLTN